MREVDIQAAPTSANSAGAALHDGGGCQARPETKKCAEQGFFLPAHFCFLIRGSGMSCIPSESMRAPASAFATSETQAAPPDQGSRRERASVFMQKPAPHPECPAQRPRVVDLSSGTITQSSEMFFSFASSMTISCEILRLPRGRLCGPASPMRMTFFSASSRQS